MVKGDLRLEGFSYRYLSLHHNCLLVVPLQVYIGGATSFGICYFYALNDLIGGVRGDGIQKH